MERQKTLLVPLDGAAVAEAAVPYAELMAKALGASLSLLAVVEREPGELFARAAEMRAYLENAREASLRQYLALLAGTLRDRGLTADVATVLGDPAEEVLAAAERLDAAMIIMATHGRGGLDRWLIGSVADKVMRTSPRPVLLVRSLEEHPAKAPPSLRRM